MKREIARLVGTAIAIGVIADGMLFALMDPIALRILTRLLGAGSAALYTIGFLAPCLLTMTAGAVWLWIHHGSKTQCA